MIQARFESEKSNVWHQWARRVHQSGTIDHWPSVNYQLQCSVVFHYKHYCVEMDASQLAIPLTGLALGLANIDIG